MKQPARNCRMYFYTALPHEFGRTAAEVANGVLFAQACLACSLVSYMTLAIRPPSKGQTGLAASYLSCPTDGGPMPTAIIGTKHETPSLRP